MWKLFYQLASPKSFYRLAGQWLPWLIVPCVLLLGYGVFAGLLLAPPDYQQGNVYRIIYIHVPAAILSLTAYLAMATAAFVSLVWRIKLADVIAKVIAPVGASFALLALVTGSIWGKPTWGTFWIWDARLTSELILLFLYLGVMALRSAIQDEKKAARSTGILTLVGVVDLPIIHYSVYWWNTLHQRDTLSFFHHSTIAPSMLHPLIAMIVGFVFYFSVVVIMRARCEVLEREKLSQWVRGL